MKQLTNEQIALLEQILNNIHKDLSYHNGLVEWVNYVMAVKNTIEYAINTKDGQFIIDAFGDNNDYDFGALKIVIS